MLKRINIVTIFPEFFTSFLETSIIKKAILQNKVEVKLFNIRDYSLDKTKRVDDHPFGGGAGLVMKLQPIMDCLKSNNLLSTYKIYPSPDAPLYTQEVANELVHSSSIEEITLICGHYEGIDSRIRSFVEASYSIGDYILTGGEASSLIIADSLIRLIDGVLTKESLEEESFNSSLLEYDQYTYPVTYDGISIPSYLLEGNHKVINYERRKDALLKTYKYREDLLHKHVFTPLEKEIIKDLKENEGIDLTSYLDENKKVSTASKVKEEVVVIKK